MAPVGSMSAAVIVIGAGSGLPVLSTLTVGLPDNSVVGAADGSPAVANSCTFPLTSTPSPTAGFGAPPNTNNPSEVAGSPSPSESWIQNPLLFTAVTTPVVRTDFPSYGERFPEPWICMIVSCGGLTETLIVV